MTLTTFRVDPTVIPMSAYIGDVFSDGPYNQTLKSVFIAARQAGYQRALAVTKRIFDAAYAADQAGLWASLLAWYAPDMHRQSAAAFVGSIAATTLTVTSLVSGKIEVGQLVPDAAAGTYISALGTGSGGVGTYTVSTSQTLASQALTSTLDFVQDVGPSARKLVNTTTSTFALAAQGASASVAGREAVDMSASPTAYYCSGQGTVNFGHISNAAWNAMSGWTIMVPVNILTKSTAESDFFKTTGANTVSAIIGVQNGGLKVGARRQNSDAIENVQITGANTPAGWFMLEVTFDATTGTLSVYSGANLLGSIATLGAGSNLVLASGNSVLLYLGAVTTPVPNFQFSDFLMWSRVLTTDERTTMRAIVEAANPQLS